MINNDAIAFASYVKSISFKFDKFDLQLIVEVLKASAYELPHRQYYEVQLAHRSQMFVIYHLARRLSEALLRGRKTYTIRLTPVEIAVLQPLLEGQVGNTSAQVVFMKIHQKTIF